MKFSASPADAMHFLSLAAAGRALDNAFEFSPHHQVNFVKADARGRLQAAGAQGWICEIYSHGSRLGWLAPFHMREGRAVFR